MLVIMLHAALLWVWSAHRGMNPAVQAGQVKPMEYLVEGDGWLVVSLVSQMALSKCSP